MDYEKLHPEDFDAIVTGELTHYALWFEDELVGIICDYFVGDTPLRNNFLRLLMRREGLSFQDKIEIVRALVPELPPLQSPTSWASLLKRIEHLKSLRNAVAHGVGAERKGTNGFVVEVVTRSGKEKLIEINPQNHRSLMEDLEKLLQDLKEARQLAADASVANPVQILRSVASKLEK